MPWPGRLTAGFAARRPGPLADGHARRTRMIWALPGRGGRGSCGGLAVLDRVHLAYLRARYPPGLSGAMLSVCGARGKRTLRIGWLLGCVRGRGPCPGGPAGRAGPRRGCRRLRHTGPSFAWTWRGSVTCAGPMRIRSWFVTVFTVRCAGRSPGRGCTGRTVTVRTAVTGCWCWCRRRCRRLSW